jgi:hypothetical protein
VEENSKRGDTFVEQTAKKYNRNRIEVVFSAITAGFPKRIHAVTIEGFQIKVFLVCFAYMMIRFISE